MVYQCSAILYFPHLCASHCGQADTAFGTPTSLTHLALVVQKSGAAAGRPPETLEASQPWEALGTWGMGRVREGEPSSIDAAQSQDGPSR